MDRSIIHEISPLMGKDVLYIADRRKKEFTYPIHNHQVYELNFVEHAAGVRRIVGDSSEVIGDFDLVLITGPDLEHVWEQGDCKSDDIREITIQFDINFGEGTIFDRNPFNSMKKMMIEAQKGLCFPLDAIMKVYRELDTLSSIHAKIEMPSDSRRVHKVKTFIDAHYRDEIRLTQLADIAGMSTSSFSRFFKLHTGRNLSEYIIDLRLGHACRQLVDSNRTVAEIGYSCGFNNLSNFNRIFKKRKGCSPSEFRENYHKTRVII